MALPSAAEPAGSQLLLLPLLPEESRLQSTAQFTRISEDIDLVWV